MFTQTQLQQVVGELYRLGLVAPVPSGASRGGGGAAFTGVRAGCYSFPTQICVDAKGRITSIAAGASSQIQVEDEGTFVAQRSTLNFIGAAVSAVDDPANDRVDITVAATGTTPESENITTENIVGVDAALADTINNDPIITSVLLILNGIVQDRGVGLDYTLGGAGNRTITWLAGTGTAADMSVTDTLLVYYTRT